VRGARGKRRKYNYVQLPPTEASQRASQSDAAFAVSSAGLFQFEFPRAFRLLFLAWQAPPLEVISNALIFQGSDNTPNSRASLRNRLLEEIIGMGEHPDNIFVRWNKIVNRNRGDVMRFPNPT